MWIGSLFSAVLATSPWPGTMYVSQTLPFMPERGGVVTVRCRWADAISLSAAKTKGLTSLSPAARHTCCAEPGAGNILAKELTYAAAGGRGWSDDWRKGPVMLTSRPDDERSRLFSCAVAVLYAHWLFTGHSAVEPGSPEGAAE